MDKASGWGQFERSDPVQRLADPVNSMGSGVMVHLGGLPDYRLQGHLIMLAQLIPKMGGTPITLNQAITVIGRSSKLCDLVVEHTSVSKQHCMLVKTDGLIYFRDLGSTNGTRVNGQRVVRGALLPGDLLTLSGVSYKVHLGPDQTASSKVALAGATEFIPITSDEGLNGSLGFGDATLRDQPSKSDVRFLSESDLLIPD